MHNHHKELTLLIIANNLALQIPQPLIRVLYRHHLTYLLLLKTVDELKAAHALTNLQNIGFRAHTFAHIQTWQQHTG